MAITVIATVVLLTCCGEKQAMTGSVADRAHTPGLSEDSVTAIISDSGVIRYRLTARTWRIYDKADTPYWDFEHGLRFERFDQNYNIDAAIQCDHAIYYSQLEQWHLRGNIRAKNLNGERFYTEELYWDQHNETVSSDSLITIIQTDRKIVGIGFESNQTFTKYTIHHPKGIFPIDENKDHAPAAGQPRMPERLTVKPG